MTNPYPTLFSAPDDQVLRLAAAVRMLVLDVDGVMTDGTVWYGEHGEALKGFNILDGLGIRLLLREGIEVAILSARDSPSLRRRAQDLGITRLSLGAGDKLTAWEGLLNEAGLNAGESAYAGDDLIDLPVLRKAGLAVTVANGHPLVAAECHWRTARPGGSGAVREICELLLAARGRLEAVFGGYLDG